MASHTKIYEFSEKLFLIFPMPHYNVLISHFCHLRTLGKRVILQKNLIFRENLSSTFFLNRSYKKECGVGGGITIGNHISISSKEDLTNLHVVFHLREPNTDTFPQTCTLYSPVPFTNLYPLKPVLITKLLFFTNLYCILTST